MVHTVQSVTVGNVDITYHLVICGFSFIVLRLLGISLAGWLPPAEEIRYRGAVGILTLSFVNYCGLLPSNFRYGRQPA